MKIEVVANDVIEALRKQRDDAMDGLAVLQAQVKRLEKMLEEARKEEKNAVDDGK